MSTTTRTRTLMTLLLFFAIVATGATAYAVKQLLLVGEETLWVPGVYIAENGSFVGMPSKLDVKAIYPGNGNVYFSTQPLTKVDTQAAARIAMLIASLYANTDPLSVDWLVSLESNTTTIGGPSASAATALAMYAVLTGRRIPGNISMTGMIDIDGSIGPVGGVVPKLRAMARMGVKVFYIPAGEEISYEVKRVVTHRDGVTIERVTRIPVNVTELGEKLGVKVVPVTSFAQLIHYVFGVQLPKVKPQLPESLQLHLRRVAEAYLSDARGNATEASRLYREYSERLPASIRGVVAQMLNSTEDSIRSALDALERGEYYVAASRAFAAAIEASQTRALLLVARDYLNGRDILAAARDTAGEYIRAAKHIVARVEDAVKSLASKHDVNALQVAIAVYTRLLEANDTIAQTEDMLEARDWLHAVLSAVYSYYRARTAGDWLSTYTLIGEGPEYNPERLVKTLKMFISYAEMLDTYLTNINIVNQYVGLARSYLDLMQQLLMRNAPPEEVLAPTINAIVNYVLALHAQYGTASRLYNASRETALYAYSIVAGKGVTPILAASYIEAGDAAEDPIVKIDFYSRAATILLILYTLLAVNHTPPALLNTPIHEKHTTTIVQSGQVSTNTTTSRTAGGGVPAAETPHSNTSSAVIHRSVERGVDAYTLLALVVVLAGIIAGLASIVAYGLGRL